jgi:hypothetical protein
MYNGDSGGKYLARDEEKRCVERSWQDLLPHVSTALITENR